MYKFLVLLVVCIFYGDMVHGSSDRMFRLDVNEQTQVFNNDIALMHRNLEPEEQLRMQEQLDQDLFECAEQLIRCTVECCDFFNSYNGCFCMIGLFQGYIDTISSQDTPF